MYISGILEIAQRLDWPANEATPLVILILKLADQPRNLKEGCLETSKNEKRLFQEHILEASKFTVGSSHHNRQFTELISWALEQVVLIYKNTRSRHSPGTRYDAPAHVHHRHWSHDFTICMATPYEHAHYMTKMANQTYPLAKCTTIKSLSW